MHEPIRQGDAVDFDLDGATATRRRLDPGAPPTFTVRDPAAAVVLDAVAMTELSVGRFTYRHQLAVDHPAGTWTAEVRVVEDGWSG
jgi:hypothetical protein